MREQFSESAKRKRNFAIVSKLCITVLHMAVIGIIWFSYYNTFAFRSHRIEGGIAAMLIYYVLYDRLAVLYKAYKIGQNTIGEVIFSQLLSFGIADLILYIECCLIANGYINILPGLGTAVVQIVLTIIWAVAAKRYYMKHIPAPNTIVIYGKPDYPVFCAKLEKKFQHIFHIDKVISAEHELPDLIRAINEQEIVILYRISYRKKKELMRYCVDHRICFYITPTVPDIITNGFESRHMIDTPLLKYQNDKNTVGRYAVKRIEDIVISLIGLILTLPITLITMAAIKLEDGGDIFFRQERYTKDWKRFSILKFRSMVMDAEKDGAQLCKANDARITKVGAVIRRFRIDEIPQLLNVLAGDMSIVGPRPERVENMEKYTQELPQFSYRLRVKGGLTGYAQLYGKYNTSASDKLKLDLMYIENQSFLMDMKLIMLTLKVLFIPESTEGFSEEGAAKMGEEVKAYYTVEQCKTGSRL